MDNAAFRSLVSNPSQNGTTSATAKPTSLGSRARSFIPMTPRNVPGHNTSHDFARQVSEHTASSSEPPLKKFKSSAAPKGTRLRSGYVDRTQLRHKEDQEEEKAVRLRNLEEQVKLGQIEHEQFEKLKEQFGVGGDVGSTHLVKGLDWKLLERVRRGEDVNQAASGADEDGNEPGKEVDVDDELERALEKDVVVLTKDERDTATDQTHQSQQTLSRNEILRRFREQRNAPAAPVAPTLNDKFKKVAVSEKPGKKKFVESINGRRREVLVITNKDGTTKRKTRWLDPEDVGKSHRPLGMEVPADIAAKHQALLDAQAVEDENEDIFADAGNDYDPLAGIESDDESDGSNAGQQPKPDKSQSGTATSRITAKKRNYFSTDDKTDVDNNNDDQSISKDPTILAALKRAAQIRQQEVEAGGDSGTSDDRHELGSGAKSSAFLAKLKEQERQDAADLDYGFGESRFGDDDDEDAGPLYDDEDGEKKKAGRKRGPKKRKGNKDNVQDVMNVLDARDKKI